MLSQFVSKILFRLSDHPVRRAKGTVVDAWDMTDVCALVRSQARVNTSAEQLSVNLERVLRTFPPDEMVMRRLSTLQQSVAGRGNEDEYCILTVYILAMDVLTTTPLRSFPKRTRSAPTSRSKKKRRINVSLSFHHHT